MYYWDKEVELEKLVGLTIVELTGLEEGSKEVYIKSECGKEFKFLHQQDCCEDVELVDIDTSSDDFNGAKILSVYESTNEDDKPSEYSESWLWTFYNIQTDKGYIHMRWLGESNGYYSESVDLIWVNKPEEPNQ